MAALSSFWEGWRVGVWIGVWVWGVTATLTGTAAAAAAAAGVPAEAAEAAGVPGAGDGEGVALLGAGEDPDGLPLGVLGFWPGKTFKFRHLSWTKNQS